MQCLTLGHAREKLLQGENVFDAALNSGLSSPSRLHDLCVKLESASPGEIKNGGLGWLIQAGFAETPFGGCVIAIGPRGICHLEFVEVRDKAALTESIQLAWPQATMHWNDAVARQSATEIFQAGQRSPCHVFVRGTPFQLRVWRALIEVPSGGLVSYGRLANKIECSGAARAVGTAVGSNPLAYLIPCHRVIRETGIIGHYRWGAERKRALLGWEAAKSSHT